MKATNASERARPLRVFKTDGMVWHQSWYNSHPVVASNESMAKCLGSKTMKLEFSVALALAISSPAMSADEAPKKGPLRVLYVGNTNTDRGRSYASFLDEKFVLVGSADRRTFNAVTLPAVDVVVLDWSQGDIDHSSLSVRKPSGWESDLKSPLGDRNRWTKPTVLLGSAGHLIAAPWKVVGGSG
jgi:hypothetical protein